MLLLLLLLLCSFVIVSIIIVITYYLLLYYFYLLLLKGRGLVAINNAYSATGVSAIRRRQALLSRDVGWPTHRQHESETFCDNLTFTLSDISVISSHHRLTAVLSTRTLRCGVK